MKECFDVCLAASPVSARQPPATKASPRGIVIATGSQPPYRDFKLLTTITTSAPET